MITVRTALRIFQWRNSNRPARLWIGVLCFIILATGAGLALRLLRSAAPPQVVTGQLLAWDIAETVKRAPGVELASGAYIPGDALLLYSRIDELDRARVRLWASTQLEPFRERLAAMAQGETLTWVIDFGATAVEQEVLMVPLTRAADATLYQYVSAEPGLFRAATVTTAVTKTAELTTASVPVAASVAPAVSAPVVSAPAVVELPPALLNQFTFDDPVSSAKAWQSMAGDWVVANGLYRQQQTKGYDYITMLTLPPQSHYQMEAQVRLGDGEMGGGFIYNAPNLDNRRGAQSVDMDRQGGFLRWGRYDDKGNYVYEGGVKLEPPIHDGQWHMLQLLTHGANSTFALDGRILGQATNRSTSGYLGLTTSQAQVDFDNVAVTALSPTADIKLSGVAADGPAVSSPLSITQAVFQDGFAAGNINRWRVLNGTWQFVDQSYQQLSPVGSDLGSISTFQGGATYTVTVRMRWLEGNMGGGLYFNMAQREDKMRSQMINYTRNGTAMQWGYFDEGGNFVFEAMSDVPNGADGAWHLLTVAVDQGMATFLLDQKPLARNVPLTYSSGYVGLSVSNSKVAFDDFTVTAP